MTSIELTALAKKKNTDAFYYNYQPELKRLSHGCHLIIKFSYVHLFLIIIPLIGVDLFYHKSFGPCLVRIQLFIGHSLPLPIKLSCTLVVLDRQHYAAVFF